MLRDALPGKTPLIYSFIPPAQFLSGASLALPR